MYLCLKNVYVIFRQVIPVGENSYASVYTTWVVITTEYVVEQTLVEL